jgi:N-acetylmuramoyl-L-alanine amidase
MPADARQNARGVDRKAILEGVYRENLRVVTNDPAPSRIAAVARSRKSMTFLGGLALVLVLIVVQNIFATDAGPSSARSSSSSAVIAAEAPLSETGDLSVASLYGLEVRTIVIDAGHGGRDPGSVGPAGTLEKDITLRVARKLRDRLQRHRGFEIIMTREDDARVPNKDRVAFANERNADLFISLHVNSLGDPSITSVETYYFGTSADESTLRKVERENRESGYSMAEFRDMVQRLATEVKLEESRRLAHSIQYNLFENLRKINPSLQNWGARTAPFIVLLGVEGPSVLVEIGCISNPEDEIRLNSDDYLEKLATFLEQGVVDYLQQNPTKNAAPGATRHATEED